MSRSLIYVFETRPQFIILSVACVLAATGAAYWRAGSVNLTYLVLALVGAMSAHASVNILNDYSDYKSGLDETLFGLVSLPLAINTIAGVIKNSENIPALVPFLGKNVVVILSTMFLIALGLFLS